MPARKRLRPASRRDVGERLKLHRRLIRIDGREYTVITPRPGARARFSTNLYHGTWHILSDEHGARLLSRLLWGLSFQRRPGTLVIIGPPHLDPNPFDAAPADPIALVPARLTFLPQRAARRLRRALASPPPPYGTVRWQTWGLAQEERLVRERGEHPWRWRAAATAYGAAVGRIGGLLTFRGAPALLRDWALRVARLGDQTGSGGGYDYDWLGLPGSRPFGEEGEMQVFPDYHRRVAVAEVSRREVLARTPAPWSPADVNPVIWRHNATVRRRRRRTADAR